MERVQGEKNEELLTIHLLPLDVLPLPDNIPKYSLKICANVRISELNLFHVYFSEMDANRDIVTWTKLPGQVC